MKFLSKLPWFSPTATTAPPKPSSIDAKVEELVARSQALGVEIDEMRVRRREIAQQIAHLLQAKAAPGKSAGDATIGGTTLRSGS